MVIIEIKGKSSRKDLGSSARESCMKSLSASGSVALLRFSAGARVTNTNIEICHFHIRIVLCVKPQVMSPISI